MQNHGDRWMDPGAGGQDAKPLSFSGTRQGDEANGQEDKLTPKK